MNKHAFFADIRRANSGVFGNSLSQSQVNGCETLLAATEGVDMRTRAYLLATAYHETGRTMMPVREAYGRSTADTVNRLENAWQKGQLKWVRTPYWRIDRDGKSWFGRGYVQLTHKINYEKMGRRLKVNLTDYPDAALNPDLAARILVIGCTEGLFTGKKLGDYINAQETDFINARRVVNGTDRAETVAGYARAFLSALEAAQARVVDEPAPTATSGLWASLIKLLTQLFKGTNK